MPPTVFVGQVPYRAIDGLDARAAEQLRRNFDAVLSQLVPTGVVMWWAADSSITVAPEGFVFADGTSYPTVKYPNLFAVIRYSQGGAGANFNVPNPAPPALHRGIVKL